MKTKEKKKTLTQFNSLFRKLLSITNTLSRLRLTRGYPSKKKKKKGEPSLHSTAVLVASVSTLSLVISAVYDYLLVLILSAKF